MTVQTTDLVSTGMHFMREENGLFRLVVLLSAQTNGSLNDIISAHNKKHQYKERDIYFITVKWNRFM